MVELFYRFFLKLLFLTYEKIIIIFNFILFKNFSDYLIKKNLVQLS